MSTAEAVELNLESEDEELQNEAGQDEAGTQDGAGDEGGAETEAQAEEEVVVSIGDETPSEDDTEARAPEWVRELRKSHRELQRENRELKAKATAAPESKAVQVGKKPTLEDHDYDTDKFEAELTAWYDRKREADDLAAKAEKEAKAQQDAWQAKLDDYAKRKAELKVKDYDDAEAAAQEVFSQTQQGVILQGAENPALVVYALGKNQGKAKELSEIKDPVKFAFAVAKLETQLKVTNRKTTPAPEKTVSGTGRVSGSVDSTLERMREEAAKTGDYTKVLQYKAQQKAKNK